MQVHSRARTYTHANSHAQYTDSCKHIEQHKRKRMYTLSAYQKLQTDHILFIDVSCRLLVDTSELCILGKVLSSVNRLLV